MVTAPRPILEVVNLTVRFPDLSRPALDRCSFSVRPGERVALVGWNGSGKTTLLLAVAGLLPFSGEVRIDGHTLDRRTAARLRRRIGFLFSAPEDQLLFPSVREDIAFSLRVRGGAAADTAERLERILADFGLADCAERAPFQLSHGQRQRAALAGILAGSPALLLLDEPTGHLDPPGRVALLRLLRKQTAAALVATHDLVFASRLCDRYLWLEAGRITEEGTDFHRLAPRFAVEAE
ncbi:MAG: ABC transporter ATP-binding protein [Acidobacteriota bacterium]